MPQKIAFVINPNAGVKKKNDSIEFIKTHFPKHIAYDFIVWKNKDDFELVKQQILEGNYSIKSSGNDVLIFTSVGYIQQIIPVNNRKIINVTLASKTS